MWNISEVKRGANEIATCLIKCITLKQKYGVTEFIFYSDNCYEQNRNRFIYLICAMREYASFSLKAKITHRFLETAHVQNEGDSMHSFTENSKKGKSIYVPMQWVTLVRSKKVTDNSYVVIEIANEVLRLQINSERQIL